MFSIGEAHQSTHVVGSANNAQHVKKAMLRFSKKEGKAAGL